MNFFVVRFGVTRGEFGGVMVRILARNGLAKISMVIPNKSDMPPKPTRKGGLGRDFKIRPNMQRHQVDGLVAMETA